MSPGCLSHECFECSFQALSSTFVPRCVLSLASSDTISYNLGNAVEYGNFHMCTWWKRVKFVFFYVLLYFRSAYTSGSRWLGSPIKNKENARKAVSKRDTKWQLGMRQLKWLHDGEDSLIWEECRWISLFSLLICEGHITLINCHQNSLFLQEIVC